MVDVITEQNYQHIEIHCVGVHMETGRTTQEKYLRELAARNGGTYRRANAGAAD